MFIYSDDKTNILLNQILNNIIKLKEETKKNLYDFKITLDFAKYMEKIDLLQEENKLINNNLQNIFNEIDALKSIIINMQTEVKK